MSQKPKLKVLVNGQSVDFSVHYLKNGGAQLGLKQAALDTKASKTTKKASKKAESEVTDVADGVRFDGDVAIIRIGGKDVASIPKPKGEKPRKAWKSAINSNLWNTQGGKDNQTIWDLRVTYGDLPQ